MCSNVTSKDNRGNRKDERGEWFFGTVVACRLINAGAAVVKGKRTHHQTRVSPPLWVLDLLVLLVGDVLRSLWPLRDAFSGKENERQ